VWCAYVGRGDDCVLDVVAEPIEVTQHVIEAKGEMSAHILEHHHLGLELANGADDIGPQVAFVVYSSPPACD